MGLSSLDCPFCGGWDGEEPPSQSLQLKDGKRYHSVCKKCVEQKVKEGARTYHYESKTIRVYD